MKHKPHLLLFAASILLTFACLSAPAATEPPIPTNIVATHPGTAAPAPATPGVDTTPTVPSNLPAGLKIVYSLNGNIWITSDSSSARQLTSDGDAGSVKLSDDGAVIVYQRGQALWAVNADGSSPRQLVDVPAFATPFLPPNSELPLLNTFDFQPKSHVIYFTTQYPSDGSFGVPPRDLYRVDADSPTPKSLLSKGGGNFTFSPNGNLLSLAESDRINVIKSDGTGFITALEFTTVNTNSDWPYIPQVVWMPDSTGFYTVIPASDIAANPSQKSRFLYVGAAGGVTAQLAEFTAVDVRVSKPLIAPNGSKVAYVVQNGTTLDVHVIDASTADMTVASHPSASLIGLWAWSPTSDRFAYWTTDPAIMQTAGLNLPPASLLDALAPYSLTWVNTDTFLYFRDGELRLGQIGNPVLTVIASGFPTSQEDTSYYDFTVNSLP